MSFIRTPEGKNVFLSIDSRSIRHNPFYKAWKAKSFTDGDVTLHFIIFDILHEPSIRKTVSELVLEMDEKYLAGFGTPKMFDESTVRKKLKEYCEAGIIKAEKMGRKAYYHRAETVDISGFTDALHYFSEVAPCGVVGSYILDKTEEDTTAFTFKHHYMTGAMDSGVLATLFYAMREKRAVTVMNMSRRSEVPIKNYIVPLRVFISVQSGRQHLIAFLPKYNHYQAYRLDYLYYVHLESKEPRFDELRAELERMQGNMWGVSVKRNRWKEDRLEHVEFSVRVDNGEEYIIRRLEREKRIGKIEQLDSHTYRFSADVYDASELVPWIRTFICRITDMNFTNKTLENKFKEDLDEMYRMYGIEKEAGK